jgi:hypothetical protein
MNFTSPGTLGDCNENDIALWRAITVSLESTEKPHLPDRDIAWATVNLQSSHTCEDLLAKQVLMLESFEELVDPTSLISQVRVLIKARHPCTVEIAGFSPGTLENAGKIAPKYIPKGSL